MKYILPFVTAALALLLLTFVVFDPSHSVAEVFSPQKNEIDGQWDANLLYGQSKLKRLKFNIDDDFFQIKAIDIFVDAPSYVLLHDNLQVENRKTYIVLDKTKVDWHDSPVYEVSQYRTGKTALICDDSENQNSWILFYFVDDISNPAIFIGEYQGGVCLNLYKAEPGKSKAEKLSVLNLSGKYKLSRNLSSAKHVSEQIPNAVSFSQNEIIIDDEVLDDLTIQKDERYIIKEGEKLIAVQYFVGHGWNSDNSVELLDCTDAEAFDILDGGKSSGYVLFIAKKGEQMEFFLSHFRQENSGPPFSEYFCRLEQYD